MSESNSTFDKLNQLYTSDNQILEQKKNRFSRLDNVFANEFGGSDRHYFSTPGRTEIGGNHTDHNYGRVLAASIDLDSIAVAKMVSDNRILLISEGYNEPFTADLGDLEKKDGEKGTTTALIKGIAARLRQEGWKTGGLQACITSDVLPGSGLSSSASIEVLIGSIFNALYNDNEIPAEQIAKIGQYAENEYFGKPCGLMDQMACAVGGIIAIDFQNPARPLVKKVEFQFDREQYNLLVVDTGGNHADLTPEYAAVPEEMRAVAGLLGKEVCREVTEGNLLKNIKLIRQNYGDRALLRVFHFIRENERVVHQVTALEQGDFKAFLQHVSDSGNSSFKWLQNVYTTKNVKEQGVSVALALTEDFILKTGEGACRVHGGGFAGTILTFLPQKAVSEYIPVMESVFGASSVKVLNIRSQGSVHLNSL